MRRLLVLGALGLAACAADPEPLESDKISSVPQTEDWLFPQLLRPVHVVRTEANVPHVYAHNRRDMAFVLGFITARDRYFMMDLSRRLALGLVSELLGEAGLSRDQEARGVGMAYVADRIADPANVPSELVEYMDAFAEGINVYIEHVESGKLAPPSELQLAYGVLGAESPASLMKPFDRRSVAGMMATIVYQSSYEGGDVGRAATAAAIPTLFEGAPFQDLRRQGAIEDLWQELVPLKLVASAPGFAAAQATSGTSSAGPQPPREMLERLYARLDAFENRLGRDVDAGFGSNAWAVAGYAAKNGKALLAGDGHLSLSVPSILWQVGLDTSVFSGGGTHQLGMTIPGLPLVAIGTNGDVAWSQTQLSGDITDWYEEEIELDADGRPVSSLFQGEPQPLVQVNETYVVADLPTLGSVGRTEVWPRWETFDGRWIADIEGREASADEPLGPGETLVNLQGTFVVPGDSNGDGVVSGVSFDYTGFDAGSVLAATDALGHAADVAGFVEATRGLMAYSQNFAVADSKGSILYGAFQPFPCRGYLEREADGSWGPGSDPSRLLDGDRYGAFRIPVEGFVPVEGASDPYECVIPHDELPQVIDPPSGYVLTANNDPGGLSFDGSLTNDAWYIGGPWDTGFRADTIDRALAAATGEGAADRERMSAIQGNHVSAFGETFAAQVLASIAYARDLGPSPTDPADQRVRALYEAEQEAVDEVESRVQGWAERGFFAQSGVETFYHPAVDQTEKDDAVATMIFNAWFSRVINTTFDDEQMPDVFGLGGTDGKVTALDRFFRGRGADNALGLASHNPDTGESIFFDVLATPEVETSHEIVLAALADALAFLRSEPSTEEPGTGGFGTDDMSAWLWGLRHQAELDSLLAEFLGDTEFAALTASFAIDTGVLPLAPSLPPGDPRADLNWFPRPGDQFGVDAANPGTSGVRFRHGSGPVMRMAVELLGGGQIDGVNIIPGGQSSLTDSPFFADQAKLWLGNETLPMRLSVDQVVAGASGREVYRPE
jgi:penicillin amidase